MLYPTLEDGHEVLGEEYCSGYTDTFGKWNTGFYCPLIIPDVPVFCCGSLVLKYCCTLGKPIPGGHYSKGYDNRHVVQVEDGQEDAEEEDDEQGENEGTESHGVLVTIPQVGGGENVAGAAQPVDDQFLNQKSLLIGAICGLVALTALITIVMCFYCSCCVLYKKRRGRRLHEGGLLYGIPVVSSSQTTTCGLLGNITRGSAGGGTDGHGLSTVTNEPANVYQSNSSSNMPTLPNFITTTTASFNPLVDYWITTSNNSPSCRAVGGCGGGASNAVIVAATATSLSPANIVGGPGGQPHHHIHESVYHHHHHYTSDFGIGASRTPPSQAPVPPPSALEPPPPYGLAVAGPLSASLINNCCENVIGSSNGCANRTPRRTGSRDSTNSANSNTNYLIQRQLSLMHANSNVSSTSSPPTACNGNSPNSSTCATAVSSTATGSNVLSRLLSSATGGSGPSRGSLPPPYFVEQYRIRNRARPPPFPTNSSRNASERSRTQETLHNLLYPLLNSTSAVTTATTDGSSNSNPSGGGRSSRRRVAGGALLSTQATDTQSEPRRRAHNHNQNRNCTSRYEVDSGGSGRRLHRSSSDRQQACETISLGAVGDAERRTGLRCPFISGHSEEEGHSVVMNNVINNLSATRARGRGHLYNDNGETRHEGNNNGHVVVGDERGSDSSGHIVGSDNNVVKILNTQHVNRLQDRQTESGGSWREGDRRRDHNRETNLIPMRRLHPATHHHQNNSQNSGNGEERNVFGNDLRERGSDSDRGSNEDGMGRRRRRIGAADEDDIIMMTGDDDEEMIAVVTTTTTCTATGAAEQEDEDDDDEQVDIIDNLVVMGCFGSGNERNDCEEDYLVGEEDNDDSETEENSMGKLSESEVNSLRMSASRNLTRLTTTTGSKDDLDEPSSEDEQHNRNGNGKETRNENTMNINNNKDDNDNSDISGCSVSVSATGTGTGQESLDTQLVMTAVAKES